MTALMRECMEEIGSEIETLGEVGEIHEYREQYNLHQISYCYFGKITLISSPNFTQKELD